MGDEAQPLAARREHALRPQVRNETGGALVRDVGEHDVRLRSLDGKARQAGDAIEETRRERVVVGEAVDVVLERVQRCGGMRQSGIVAAAALHALEHHVDRLADDHALAARLFDGIAGLPGLAAERPQTNIVFADVTSERAAGLLAHLRSRDVLATGGKRLRFVTHLDVDRAGIDRAVAAAAEYLND